MRTTRRWAPRLDDHHNRGDDDSDKKCVLEELSENTLVMFTYESPDGTHINMALYDPAGVEIFSRTDESKGSHGFTTEKEGDYKGKGTSPLPPFVMRSAPAEKQKTARRGRDVAVRIDD